MAEEDFFESIDPELFDIAVVIDYRIPLVPVRNNNGNGIWIRIRALAGLENARVGVDVVNAAREESQRSLEQPLQVQNPERPVNSAQAPSNRIQEPTNAPSNATQSTTHAASTRNSLPQRRRYYEENPPTAFGLRPWLQPNSDHASPTSDRARNPYQRFRNFVRTIRRRRRG